MDVHREREGEREGAKAWERERERERKRGVSVLLSNCKCAIKNLHTLLIYIIRWVCLPGFDSPCSGLRVDQKNEWVSGVKMYEIKVKRLLILHYIDEINQTFINHKWLQITINNISFRYIDRNSISFLFNKIFFYLKHKLVHFYCVIQGTLILKILKRGSEREYLIRFSEIRKRKKNWRVIKIKARSGRDHKFSIDTPFFPVFEQKLFREKKIAKTHFFSYKLTYQSLW